MRGYANESIYAVATRSPAFVAERRRHPCKQPKAAARPVNADSRRGLPARPTFGCRQGSIVASCWRCLPFPSVRPWGVRRDAGCLPADAAGVRS